jgi:hypothetical protein
MDKMVRLLGEELDLKQLARSFRKGPVRVEKGDEYYYLLLDSEGQREDAELLDAGADIRAQSNFKIRCRYAVRIRSGIILSVNADTASKAPVR